MKFKDYYKTLGLTKKATNAEVKQAYRKFARKYHPDVNQGNTQAEAKFKEIGEAYEVLGTPDNRRKYDDLGANWRMYEQSTPGDCLDAASCSWRSSTERRETTPSPASCRDP